MIGGVKVGISICEDIWTPIGPLATQAAGGAELNININGSPYHCGEGRRPRADAGHPGRRTRTRRSCTSTRSAVRTSSCSTAGRWCSTPRAPARACAAVRRGPHDRRRPGPAGLPQAAARPAGKRTDARAPDRAHQREHRGATGPVKQSPIAEPLETHRELYDALVLGTRDYVRKNGFTDVVIGLSGGIDSTHRRRASPSTRSGADHVHGVSMPSRYSSDHSKTDAQLLAENLGIDYRTISIEPAFQAYLDMLAPSFEGREPGLTEENLQSRCRGQLADGAVERVRLDGADHRQQERDGGRLLHDLRRLRRRLRGHQGRPQARRLRAVPLRQPRGRARGDPRERDHQAAVGRAASRPARRPVAAALRGARPDPRSCTSSRTAPPARSSSWATTRQIVRRITRLVDIAEYKRRQCPPGVRVSPKAFGKDRRMPITNGYRG